MPYNPRDCLLPLVSVTNTVPESAMRLVASSDLTLLDEGWLEAVSRDAAVERLRSLVEAEEVDAARALAARLVERWPEDTVIRHWARVLAPPTVRWVEWQGKRSRESELAWLRMHRHEYPGCWIALYGDELVAADPSWDFVHNAVQRSVPSGDVLVVFQPPVSPCN
jgi:hypothetical protein